MPSTPNPTAYTPEMMALTELLGTDGLDNVANGLTDILEQYLAKLDDLEAGEERSRLAKKARSLDILLNFVQTTRHEAGR